jgi:hypothetical protein
LGVPVEPDVNATWPADDGEGEGSAADDGGREHSGSDKVKGNEGLTAITPTGENAEDNASAVGAVAGEAMMRRTLAAVHMSCRRATGISGSAKRKVHE